MNRDEYGLQELRPTRIEELAPFGTFDGEYSSGADRGLATWYKGKNDDLRDLPVATYIDSEVRSILREYAEERLAKGITGVPKFLPGPIGIYVRQKPRVVTEQMVADYHRREREGNRKLMLALRVQNDASLAALAEGW